MALTIDGTTMISTAEANQRSGLSQTYICLAIRRGKIAGRKIGNAWMVDAASFERFLAQPRKPGPKPKPTSEEATYSMPKEAVTKRD